MVANGVKGADGVGGADVVEGAEGAEGVVGSDCGDESGPGFVDFENDLNMDERNP